MDKNNTKKKIFAVLPYIIISIVILVVISMISGNQTKSKNLKYYEVVELFEKGEVTSYELNLSSGALKYKIKGEDTTYKYSVPSVNIFISDVHEDVVEFNKENPNNKIEFNYVAGSSYSVWSSILPMAIMSILLFAGLYFMMRRSTQSVNNDLNQTMMFGKARVKMSKDQKKKKTFADVAGADEEKEELEEIVDFLRNPSKYNDIGARIPKGVLLVGPPGTGKTLLARAVAGEADVPFFSISGSDFVEMYVGVGASRVRDLFQQAKKNSPSIIFIDEIDAVGRHRGAGMGGGHDEREQTLNQLLVEMDGFGENEGVIVMAATNRRDILDPALLRPGRFDRQITVNYPDVKGRREILNVHAKGKPFGPDVDFDVIAKQTAGFTGADLENLLNEAALLTARRQKKAITMNEIEEAARKVVVGTEKKSRVISDKEKRETAYHEAGHAVATFCLESQDPVHEISIIPRGMAGGYTMSLPSEDKMYKFKKEMLDDIVVLLGGMGAETIIFNDTSTGVSNDLERAAELARRMVTKFGMSAKLGPVSFGSSNDEVFLGKDFSHTNNYSDRTAFEIDEEVNKIISESFERCKALLEDNINKLHEIAAYLIENEKMSGEKFSEIMTGSEKSVTESEETDSVSGEETEENSEN
ncbi:MAG: ATP-dependent zinc metalloprotease FtsH [Acutalibacteraceae bacterium]